MRIAVLLSVLVMGGCATTRSSSPIAFSVSPEQIAANAGLIGVNESRLTGTLTNISNHQVRVVATGRGTTNVIRFSCEGREIAPTANTVSYIVHPSTEYPSLVRTLEPGGNVSFPIRFVRYDWKSTGPDRELTFPVIAAGHCEVRFEYTPPPILNAKWTASSNKVRVDVSP